MLLSGSVISRPGGSVCCVFVIDGPGSRVLDFLRVFFSESFFSRTGFFLFGEVLVIVGIRIQPRLKKWRGGEC